MQELDILFLNLHRRYLNTAPNHGGFLGIYLLSAFLRKEGYEAKGFSGSLETGLQNIDKFCSNSNVSMIGLYCDFDNITENIFISHYVKENFNLPVIVGGPQATALEKDFFEKSKCDAVVRYEGELTVLELANFFLEGIGRLENILGITYLKNGILEKNLERPVIKNLDALPFIDQNCYLNEQDIYRGLSLMTGRGCPFQCAFCHEGAHTRQVRFRSVENVLEEIDIYLEKYYGQDSYILFNDDTFTLNTERVKKICDGLAERRKKYDLSFFCEGHIHTLYKNPEMIQYLANAGCIRIQLGIEAGTEKILKAYGKHSTPEEIFEVVRLCRDAGIQEIFGNIILGGANFTREVYEADKKFVHDLILESQGTLEIGVVSFWPLAETPMTRCPDKFNIKICDSDFITSVGDFPQVETEKLDRFTIAQMEEELQREILNQMVEMIENWQVPTERIVKWFPKHRDTRHYSMWYVKLLENEILHSYYEMIKLGEGFHSNQITDLVSAHPLRVAILYKYLKKIDDSTVEICGEKFFGKEIEILLLTTGKLSVEEISNKVDLKISDVLEVLNRIENKHLIVYSLH